MRASPYKGEVIDIVPRAGATREGLGLLMAGVHPGDHEAAQAVKASPSLLPA